MPAPTSPSAGPAGPTEPRRPWREGLAAGVGAALLAGLAAAVIDAAAAGAAALPTLLALWAPVALGVGLGLGLVLAGVRATFGDRAVARAIAALRDDRGRDVAATAVVLAAAALALVLIVVVGGAARALVVGRERADVGARLLGVVVVGAVPAIALLGFPVYRATRRIAALIPPVGPAPRVVVLGAAGAAGVVALALYVVFAQLDWRALPLGGYGLIALVAAGAPALAALGAGPLAPVRRAIPARGAIVAGGAIVAAILPVALLRGDPDPAVKAAVLDRARGGAQLVAIYGGLLDRDGDGYTAFFGGPDCDDTNPHVHPGAPEIPGNGIDDNCRGGDRPLDAPGPDDDDDDGDGDGDAAAPVAAAPVDPCPPGGRPGDAAAALAPGKNVLFLIIDTVRADRLGAAGYRRDGRSLTPRIDELAAGGVRFARAYAQAPNTPRSVPSLLTGRYPSAVAMEQPFRNYPRLRDDNVTVFELLQAAGWRTLGFSSHFYFRDERNVTQGFDRYDNEGALDIAPSNHDVASPRIVPKVTAALAELGRSRERFAMWVHLFEPHSSYVVHDEFPITARGTAGLEQKYDYEIAYVDRWVGTILDALADAGLADDTIVVLTSDHGEAFGVHTVAGERMFFHGQTLYDELLRVPLIVRAPGVAPAVVDAVVQLVDVTPTVIDAVGLARAPTFQGRSLVPALRGDPLPPRPAFAELLPAPSWKHEAKAVISADGRWKLYDRVSDRRIELYDLEADPEERRDLATRERERVAELEAVLLDFVEVTLARALEGAP